MPNDLGNIHESVVDAVDCDEVEARISVTGLVTFYLAHNQVRLRSFVNLKPAQSWLRRRPARVVRTVWE